MGLALSAAHDYSSGNDMLLSDVMHELFYLYTAVRAHHLVVTCIYLFPGQPLGGEVLSFQWKTSGNRCKYVRYTCPKEAKKSRWRKK